MQPQPTPDEPNDSGGISLDLEFPKACCETCGAVDQGSPCVVCGTLNPAAERGAAALSSRVSALSVLVAEIRASADALPPAIAGAVPLTAEMFGAAIAESRVSDLLRDLLELPGRLANLDLNSGASIGRGARRALIDTVSRLRRGAELSEDIAAFDPGEEGRELQNLSLKIIAKVALATAYQAELLIAPTHELAQQAAIRASDHLDAAPFSRIGVLLDELPPTSLNDRVARALGRAGTFTDEQDHIDLGLVAKAFSDEPDRWTSLGQSAQARFAIYLKGHEIDPAAAIGLAVPLLAMARVSRPLAAERSARATAALMMDAAEADKDKVVSILEAAADHGPRLLTTGGIAQELLQRVSRSLDDQAEIDDRTIYNLLEAYRSLCEGPWRELGWNVVQLHATARQGEVPSGHAPDLAELRDRLVATPEPAAQLLVAGVDPPLRNAAAHSQWAWNSDTATLTTTRQDSWTLDEVFDRVDALVAALVGSDAGWVVGHLASGLQTAYPEWMADGRSADMIDLNTVLAIGLAGGTVTDVRDRGRSIFIAEPGADLNQSALMSGLLGIASKRTFVPDDAFRVVDGQGATVLDVAASDLQFAATALASHANLVVYIPFASSRIRLGHNPADVLQEMIAGQLMVVGGPVIDALADSRPVSPAAGPLAAQLDFIIAVAERWDEFWEPRTQRLIQRLETLRAHAERAGSPDAKDHLSSATVDLMRWATDRQGSLLPRS